MEQQENKDKSIGMVFLWSLTPAERDVFFSTTEGYSHAEIARRLKIKVSTLKKHRENICKKLRDVLEGECSCEKTSRFGFSWLQFSLKTGLIDGQNWLDRVKKSKFCRN